MGAITIIGHHAIDNDRVKNVNKVFMLDRTVLDDIDATIATLVVIRFLAGSAKPTG